MFLVSGLESKCIWILSSLVSPNKSTEAFQWSELDRLLPGSEVNAQHLILLLFAPPTCSKVSELVSLCNIMPKIEFREEGKKKFCVVLWMVLKNPIAKRPCDVKWTYTCICHICAPGLGGAFRVGSEILHHSFLTNWWEATSHFVPGLS